MLHRLLTFLLLLHYASTYKILVYNSKFGHSHSNFMGSIADILVEAGHNVTSLIPVLEKDLRDGTTKSKIIHIYPQTAVSEEAVGDHVNFFEKDIFELADTFKRGVKFGSMYAEMCRTTLEHEDILQELKNEKFDVFIAEDFDTCGIALSHVLKPKSLIIGSTGCLVGEQYDHLGIPTSLSFNPSLYTASLNVHSIWDRAMNLYAEFLIRTIFRAGIRMTEELFRKKYGPDFPSIEEISSYAAFGFANAEPLIDYARPTLHRVIDIGGLGAKEPKPLDEKWESILSKRKRAVLISFGSVAKSYEMRDEVKQSILKMVSSFPETMFIWKYEKEDDFSRCNASKHDNLVLDAWTPQNDLLSDKRLAAFVSHGGMGSTQETALRAVPALFVPMFGDQPRNAGMLKHNGFGLVCDKFDLDKSDKLIAAMKEILENPVYKENAKRVAGKLSKKPFQAKEMLIKYVEFAAEFGPSPALRPASHDMNFVEYYNLDIIVIATLLIVAISYVVLISIVKILSKFVRRKEKIA